MPNEIRQLIAKGKTEQALERLAQLAAQDNSLSQEVLALQSRFNRLSREQRMGVLSPQDANIERNRIEQAILGLATELPAGAGADGGSTPPPPLALEESLPASSPGDPATSWIAGAGALLLILGLLLIVPCPTESQFFAFRIVLAMAAAALASQLPGMFHFEWPPAIKASGALTVFALLYLVNPAQLVGEGKCATGPFEFTIALVPDNSLQLSPSYPKLEEAQLKIRLDNKWEDAAVDADGDADYKSIPAEFRDARVAVQLSAKYWKPAQDTILLQGKSAVLRLVPDGSLAKVEGRIWEVNGATPIPGVKVDVADQSASTDAEGRFSIAVPPERQQAQHLLSATKAGYLPLANEPIRLDGGPVSFRMRAAD